jgi:hypothetical protein
MSQLTKAVRTLLPHLRRPFSAQKRLTAPPNEQERLAAEVTRLQAEVTQMRARLAPPGFEFHVPPGHYYSPIHSVEEVRQNHQAIFGPVPRELPGIDLNEAGQIELFEQFLAYFPQIELPPQKAPGLRYYTENNWYPYGDAIFLYCMMRHFRPQRTIEVGSGFSSCVILDTNELFFGSRIACTFIEPHPERFYKAIKPEDRGRVEVIEQPVQQVPVSRFQELAEGDILLIDSSHVSKVNSDVNYLYFEVLPALAPGVLVHVHDIFYPFRYPEKWIYKGWSWNEAYLLRALLMFNRSYKVRFWNAFFQSFHGERLAKHLPRAVRSGASIWIQRT